MPETFTEADFETKPFTEADFAPKIFTEADFAPRSPDRFIGDPSPGLFQPTVGRPDVVTAPIHYPSRPMPEGAPHYVEALWQRFRNSDIGKALAGQYPEAAAGERQAFGIEPEAVQPNRLEQGGLIPAVVTPFAGAIPRVGKATTVPGKIAAGAANAAAGLAEGVVTPLAPLAETPVLGRVISGTFAADMLGHVPGQVEAVKEAVKAGDLQGAVEGSISAAASLGLGGLSAVHAASATAVAGIRKAAGETPKTPEVTPKVRVPVVETPPPAEAPAVAPPAEAVPPNLGKPPAEEPAAEPPPVSAAAGGEGVTTEPVSGVPDTDAGARAEARARLAAAVAEPAKAPEAVVEAPKAPTAEEPPVAEAPPPVIPEAPPFNPPSSEVPVPADPIVARREARKAFKEAVRVHKEAQYNFKKGRIDASELNAAEFAKENARRARNVAEEAVTTRPAQERHPDRPYSIIDALRELGTKQLDLKAFRETEDPRYKDTNWTPPASLAKHFSLKGTIKPDVWASGLGGLIKRDMLTSADVAAEIDAAWSRHIGWGENKAAETKALNRAAQDATFQGTILEGDKGGEKISVQQLEEGQSFKGPQGDKFTVTEVVSDPNQDGRVSVVKVDDGAKFGQQQIAGEETIHIKKGSLKQADPDAWLKSKKISTEGHVFDATAGIPIAIYNAAIDIVIAARKAGRALHEAVAEGARWLKARYPHLDEDAVARELGSAIPGYVHPEKPPVIPPGQPALPGMASPAGTSIKDAYIEAERAAEGKPALSAPERRSDEQVNAEAVAAEARDPEIARKLTVIGLSGERPLFDWEQQVLTRERVRIKSGLQAAVDKVTALREQGRHVEALAAEEEVNHWSDRKSENDLAVGHGGVGTVLGRALRFRQTVLNDDFSFASLESDWRKAHDYRRPNRDEIAALQKEAADYKAAFEREQAATAAAEAKNRAQAIQLADAEARAAAAKGPQIHPDIISKAEGLVRRLETAADAAWKRLKAKLSQAGAIPDVTILNDLAIIGAAKIARGIVEFGRWSKAMADHVGNWMTPEDLQQVYAASQAHFDATLKKVAPKGTEAVRKAAQKSDAYEKIQDATEKIGVRMAAGEMDAMVAQVQKLHRALIEADPKMSRDAVVDWIHGVLQAHDPSLTRLDTMDAISGRGRFTLPSKDEVSVIVRDQKQQLRLVGHQEDILAGAKSLPPTGPQRDKMSTAAQIEQQKLNELIRKHGVGNTDGPAQLAGALKTRKRALENRMNILRQEIAARERFVKTKTPSPTDAELEAMQAEYAQVKAEHEAVFPKDRILTPEQQEQIATAHAERSAQMWEKRLAEAQKGKLWTGKRASKPFTTPEIEAIRARRDAARDAAQELHDIANREPDALAAARKSEAEWTRRLEMAKQGRFEDGRKAKVPFTTPEIEAIRARANAAKAETLKLRQDAKPKKTAEEVQLSQLKARISAETARKLDQIARNDFSPRAKRPPLKLDKAAIDAQFALDQIRKKHAAQKAQWEYERLNKAQKVFTTSRKVLNTVRDFLTGFDDSAIGRQGGILTKASPWRARGALVAHVKAALSDRRMFEEHQKIALRPNSVNGNYKTAGLDFADFGDQATHGEEAIRSSFSHHIPGLGASQRAFVTYLNVLRADVFDAMVKSLTRSGAATPVELKAIGKFINLAAGRGQIGPASWKAANNALADIFFAPKLAASRFQLLAGQPLWGGSLRTRKLIAQEYLKYGIARAIIHTLAVMAGASVAYNPLSSDSEKLKFGHMRIDPTSGLGGTLRVASRLAMEETVNRKGQLKPLTGPGVKYGGQDEGSVFASFLRTKLAPFPQAIAEFKTGKSAIGMPVTKGEALRHLFLPVPLLAGDIYEAGKEQGLSAATVGGIMSFLGESVNTYDENKPWPKAK